MGVPPVRFGCCEDPGREKGHGSQEGERSNTDAQPSNSPSAIRIWDDGAHSPIVRNANLLGKVAGPTRFELATSGVTGQRSNQLNYDPARTTAETLVTAVSAHVPNLWRPSIVAKAGGRYRARTCDSRRVKPVLYQLS
jgi:hypothetical protein